MQDKDGKRHSCINNINEKGECEMFEQDIVKVSAQKFETKQEVILYLAKLAYQSDKITDVDSYVDAVLKREEMISTAVGHQIAIPHGESDVVESTFVACLKLDHPMMWDEEETNLIFMIGVPLASRNKEHLRILAMLSRHLMNEEFRKQLQNVMSDEQFYQCIKPLEKETIGDESI